MKDFKAEITFDEFFKWGAKVFFTELGFEVQTELELLKLPKKLDLALIKSKAITQSDRTSYPLTLLKYFQTYNLISYKSPSDPIKKHDFHDALIYLNAYLNLNKKATYKNTTMSIFCNHKPQKFLTENAANINQLQEGHWKINYGLFDVHLINLNSTSVSGVDAFFLKDFAKRESLEQALLQNPDFFPTISQGQKRKKMVDILKNFIYFRSIKIEGQPLEGFSMATAEKIDITELVRPYYEEGVEKGLSQGIEQGIEKGLSQGLTRGKMQTARNMLLEGFDIQVISKITGLPLGDIKKLNKN